MYSALSMLHLKYICSVKMLILCWPERWRPKVTSCFIFHRKHVAAVTSSENLSHTAHSAPALRSAYLHSIKVILSHELWPIWLNARVSVTIDPLLQVLPHLDGGDAAIVARSTEAQFCQ